MVSEAKPLIDDDIRRAYAEDGAAVVRGVVDPAWLERLRDAVDRDIAEPGPYVHGYTPADGNGRFHGNLRIWETDRDFREYCLHSPLPAMAADLLGAKRLNLRYDQLFGKEPSTCNPTR